MLLVPLRGQMLQKILIRTTLSTILIRQEVSVSSDLTQKHRMYMTQALEILII